MEKNNPNKEMEDVNIYDAKAEFEAIIERISAEAREVKSGNKRKKMDEFSHGFSECDFGKTAKKLKENERWK